MTSVDGPGPGVAPSATVVLGVDVGSTNTKAVLLALPGDGAPVEVATAATPTPAAVDALLAAVRRVVEEVLVRSPAPPAAVGVASMAETGVPLGDDGRPLTELLRWDGHRAGEHAAALARTNGGKALFAATGVRPSAKVPLATWAWLRDQGVRMRWWAGAADLVVLALTGRLCTDHTLAGRTMAYRVDDGRPAERFDAGLLALVGLRPDQLPDVVPPDGAAGVVDARAASAAGLDPLLDRLRPGTPVVVAGHDHAVAAWAAGARGPGARADSVGTAEAVLTVLPHPPEPAPVAAAGMSWVRTVPGRDHAVLAGSASAGAMLGWLQDRLGDVPLADALVAAAEDLRRDPRPTGLLVLPYLSGRQSPAPDPGARVVVGGEDAAHPAPPGRLARAVLEGVCLQARWMLAEQEALAQRAQEPSPSPGPPSGPVAVLGTAVTTIPAWAGTKRRVSRDALSWVRTGEPVAAGAALLAAVRAGLLGAPAEALEAAPTLAAATGPPVEVTTDGPEEHESWDAAYEQFLAAATRKETR